MSWGNRHSAERTRTKLGLSAALFAMLAGAMTVSVSGCVALPALSIIPSVVSFVYNAATKKDGDSDADARKQDPEPTEEASKPAPQLTAENVCHMIALARPDLMVVELRKTAAGAPEYRELRLLKNSEEDARWSPVVDTDTGPNGWRPAVNFLKMDFNPPLTDVIPSTGSCYLAYVPLSADPNSPQQAQEFKSASGDAAGAFSWEGQTYQYKVERTLPCLASSS
jgi:hypothetical protein